MKIIRWIFIVRQIKTLIKITEGEKAHFQFKLEEAIKSFKPTEIKYCESRIELKNEVLFILKNLID